MTGILNLLMGVRPSDPYFEYTTLLLPGNGTNGAQNNTFLDGSTNNFTITRNGNTTQGTFSPFSQTGWGGAFNTSTTYLTITDTANLRFGSSNFTIEAWVYRNASGTTQTIASKGASTPTGWVFQISSADKLVFTDTSTSITGATSIAANTWTYVAVVRAGTGTNQTTLYVNGTSDGTGTSATNFNQTSNMLVGADRSTTNFANGYISNLRLSNTNRTISSTPTTALTADANTIFLSLNLNRFQYTDSTAAYTNISATGTPSVVAFSPFNPTASWSAATYGGSGYFDGSGDYLSLSTPVVAATGDFTIEGWFYLTNAIGTRQDIIYQNSPTVSSEEGRLIISISAAGFFSTFVGGTNSPGNILSSQTIQPNTWYHFAYTRNSNTFTQYLNGVSQGSASGTISINQNNLLISNNPTQSPQTYWFGYLSNIRIVNGTAVYTGAFTLPTAPITNAGSTSAASYPSTTNVNTSFASSATSLLLNFTNAGIYDATSKNDLETVANAQISTTQSKWGGSSMSFDGTGDYLSLPNINTLNLQSGDFTVECWLYTNNAATSQTFIWLGGTDSSSATLRFAVDSNGIYLYMGNSGLTGWEVTTGIVGSISSSTWTHVAATRSGNSYRVFINGTQVGTTITNSNAIGASTQNRIGALNFTSGGFPVYREFNGYLQDVRITKGYARYTANFTPPTAAFPTL